MVSWCVVSLVVRARERGREREREREGERVCIGAGLYKASLVLWFNLR
jgi:hypothetical protein